MIEQLKRDLRLLRLGIVGELRNPAFRLLAVIAALAGGAYAANQGPLVGATSIQLASWGGRAFALAACFWCASGALRDQNAQLGAVLRSKPVDGARWVILNWATGMGLWLALLACLFVGAIIGQVTQAGPLAIIAHGLAFVRAALVMIAVATLGFCLSRVTRSPLGASVVVLAFVCVISGLQLIPRFLRPDYTQNLPLFLAVGAVLLVLTAGLLERFRRGELRQPLFPVLGLMVCVALSYGGGSRAYRLGQPPESGSIPDMMALQHLEKDRRIPGFWLPDGHGGTLRTAQYAGKVLIVYVFAPGDLDSSRTLGDLETLRNEFGAQGVQPIGVCISPDHGDGAHLANTGGFHFPIGSDLSTTGIGPPPESSISNAYDLKALPMLVITDRRRRAREIVAESTVTLEQLRKMVKERLAEEPE